MCKKGIEETETMGRKQMILRIGEEERQNWERIKKKADWLSPIRKGITFGD